MRNGDGVIISAELIVGLPAIEDLGMGVRYRAFVWQYVRYCRRGFMQTVEIVVNLRARFVGFPLPLYYCVRIDFS